MHSPTNFPFTQSRRKSVARYVGEPHRDLRCLRLFRFRTGGSTEAKAPLELHTVNAAPDEKKTEELIGIEFVKRYGRTPQKV